MRHIYSDLFKSMLEQPAQYELAHRHAEFKQVREQDAVDVWKHAGKFYEMLQERDPNTREIPVVFEHPEDSKNIGRGTNDSGCLYETETGVQAAMVLCRDSHNWSNATFFYGSAHDTERSRIITPDDLPRLETEITEWFKMITQEVLPHEPQRPYDVEALHYTMELPRRSLERGQWFILKLEHIPVATVIVCPSEHGYAADFFRRDPDALRPLEKYWGDRSSH